MAVMLITHAMGVVAETAQRVVVMYAGKVVEEAPVERAVRQPAPSLHAGPDPLDPAHRPRRPRTRRGWRPSPAPCPSLIDPPAGCRFAPRCRFAFALCTERRTGRCARSQPGHKRGLHPANRRRERAHERTAAARHRT